MTRSLTKKLSVTKLLALFLGLSISCLASQALASSYRYEMDFDARYGVHTYGDPSVATHRHTIQFEQTAKYNEYWSWVLGFRGEAEAAYASDPARYANTDVSKYDSQTFLPRDNYLQFKASSIQIRAGYQQVVWGEAFGSYYADIVNPKDYREAGLGDLSRNRLDSPILNMQWIGASSSVQLLYIPVSMPSLLPKNGSDFAAFKLPDAYSKFTVSLDREPLDPATRGEGGIRVTKQIFDFDFSVFYLNYYDRFPLFRLQPPTAAFNLHLAPEYMPLQTAGMTVTADFGGFLFRSEVLEHLQREINTLTPTGIGSEKTDELVYVVGLDLPPWEKWQLSVQYSESKLLLEPASANAAPPNWAFRNELQSLATVRLAKTFSNDWMIEALGTEFLRDESTLVQAKMVIPVADQLELILGADNFDGTPGSQLGKYKSASRAWVMFKAIIKK